MEWFPWLFIGLLGIALLPLFWYLLKNKNQTFDASLLGLITLSIFMISVALIQPPTLKYGDLELTLKKVQKATQDAEVAGRLASEAAAIMFWNGGRLDGADVEKARQIFKSIYGDENGKKLIEYYIDQGILKTSDSERAAELEGQSHVSPPKGIESPYLEMYLNK